MANKSKKKGTEAETRVVNYLKEHGIEAQRRALSGSKDIGDIEVRADKCHVILEVKSGQQTANYSRTTKQEWLRQTREEQSNAHMFGYLVIARYKRSIEDYEVWDADGRRFWYLDDFVSKFLK